MEMNKFQTTEQNKVDIFLQHIPEEKLKQSRLNRHDEINKAIDDDFNKIHSGYSIQSPSFTRYHGSLDYYGDCGFIDQSFCALLEEREKKRLLAYYHHGLWRWEWGIWPYIYY